MLRVPVARVRDLCIVCVGQDRDILRPKGILQRVPVEFATDELQEQHVDRRHPCCEFCGKRTYRAQILYNCTESTKRPVNLKTDPVTALVPAYS